MSVRDFVPPRKSIPMFEKNLNDYVEELHFLIADEPVYARLLSAVWDEQSVEGSLATDNVLAAELLRKKAQQIGNIVKDEKLHTIVKSLGVVLRRYKIDRVTRRTMLGGKIYSDDQVL